MKLNSGLSFGQKYLFQSMERISDFNRIILQKFCCPFGEKKKKRKKERKVNFKKKLK